MFYGRAVEELVAQEIRSTPALRRLFRHIGRSGGSHPDFVGLGRYQGLTFDTTTNTVRQVRGHMRRPYATRDYSLITYDRPAGFTVFP